jgi:hypothetical protein
MKCSECGNKVETLIAKEIHKWGQSGDMFESDTPIRFCARCDVTWIDDAGQAVITLAQFKFEKSKGIVRTEFCSNYEQELWEKA